MLVNHMYLHHVYNTGIRITSKTSYGIVTLYLTWIAEKMLNKIIAANHERTATVAKLVSVEIKLQRA